ncbi:hypothetical protein ACOMCW_003282 [Yersinia enterocolitica]|uniref:hypothetical protein n=1 Tax=Yersinia enterocolitica TaxID=630 RepID=UPI0029ACCA40|nr:hypothetical protein [Yersinia enterocolitica]HEI6814781.1 hypothetical protein [Yersinia enterocolitica]
MKFHIFSKCPCTLILLKLILKKLLVSYVNGKSVKNKIELHGRINNIYDSATNKTSLILIDAHGFNSYEVNKFFINTKLRYKTNIVLICDAEFKEYFTPFMYDAIIYKHLGVSEIKKEMTFILNGIYKSVHSSS